MEFIIIILVSFLVTGIAIPITIKVANKFGLVDDPHKRPHPAHIQKRIVPRAGGLAIYLSIVIASLLFLPFEKHLLGILLAISILLITGLLDDKVKNFSPYFRLGLLFLSALVAVGSGIGISFISNPLSWLGIFSSGAENVIRLDQVVLPVDIFGPRKIIFLADILALFWIVTVTQIVNWSKGVDGQMPGITSIAALTLGFLSLMLYYQGDPNQLNVAKLAFVTAGASFGFLIANWHPAKIFPGFSGSTILAFMLAVLAILSGAKIATALLVLTIPTVDFLYTFCRRILSGRSPVWGDRGHLHHHLLNLGWSHQRISLFYMLGSAILGAVALLGNTEVKALSAAVVVITFLGVIIWLNLSGGSSKLPDPGNG